MSEKSNPSQRQSKFRAYLIRLFQIFIVICLVDGFLDIAYPLARFTKYNFDIMASKIKNSGPMKLNESEEVAIPLSGFSVINKPGIRNIVSEYHSKTTNVNADGLRDNGQGAPAKVSYAAFLLGSSTAFGYGVSDNQTIAAHLEREFNDTRIYNYAGLGQPLPDNILRWYDLQKKNGKPDFVILAGINYQLFNDCRPTSKVNLAGNTHPNILSYLSGQLIDRLSSERIMPCASSEGLELAVRSSILSIENAVAFARKSGTTFYMVNLPSPYDANVNVSNLLKTKNEKNYISTMQKAINYYHQELTKLDIPELIDLSNSLPTDKPYFLDVGGHLSKEGNRLISAKIFDHIAGNKSHVTARLPQHAH